MEKQVYEDLKQFIYAHMCIRQDIYIFKKRLCILLSNDYKAIYNEM